MHSVPQRKKQSIKAEKQQAGYEAPRYLKCEMSINLGTSQAELVWLGFSG